MVRMWIKWGNPREIWHNWKERNLIILFGSLKKEGKKSSRKTQEEKTVD
jgi:hypothetical protein